METLENALTLSPHSEVVEMSWNSDVSDSKALLTHDFETQRK